MNQNLTLTAAAVSKLIQELSRLPGIGPKSAQRLTYYLLRAPEEQAMLLAEAILSLKQKVTLCSICFNVTESDLCLICRSDHRDCSKICIVEQPQDILALEHTRIYSGLYHVLHGAISPLNGIGPDQLKLKELLARLTGDEVSELVIATNPTLEGEATAMYIRRYLAHSNIKVTHLARGLPVGGSLEYTDDLTLSRAFQGRQEL